MVPQSDRTFLNNKKVNQFAQGPKLSSMGIRIGCWEPENFTPSCNQCCNCHTSNYDMERKWLAIKIWGSCPEIERSSDNQPPSLLKKNHDYCLAAMFFFCFPFNALMNVWSCLFSDIFDKEAAQSPVPSNIFLGESAACMQVFTMFAFIRLK